MVTKRENHFIIVTLLENHFIRVTLLENHSKRTTENQSQKSTDKTSPIYFNYYLF
jgi:hypothetical protein